MHSDTYDVLHAHRLLSKESFATAIARVLEGARNGGDPIDEALIVDEIRSELVGDDHPEHVVVELNEMVGELTRPRGEVYVRLSDGLSLCTASVRRKTTTAEGVTIVVTKQGRFVSDEPQTVTDYRLQPATIRAERTLERLALQIEKDTDRIPALAQHTPRLIARLRGTMDAQLPAPGGGS